MSKYIQPVYSRALCALISGNLISTLDAIEYAEIAGGAKMPHMREAILDRINGLYLRRILSIKIPGYNWEDWRGQPPAGSQFLTVNK